MEFHLTRCTRCVMPNTRPDVPFVDGVCAACRTYAARPTIDWESRRAALEDLLERHRNTSGYDCIVPSSGGKDSHAQVLQLIEMGARPLVVTATTCHLTPIGRENINNLGRYATTIEVTPNREVRAKLNRLGLQLVGDISWPEHVAIFTIPFKVAAELGIPLIFYGENPQNQYGGPPGTELAQTMTRRWVSEFGGFLGLRPADMVGMMGIRERDMLDYEPPSADRIAQVGIEAHFLGQYLPWDSEANARLAIAAGMRYKLPTPANVWAWENLDNAQTGIHDHAMFRKYGYGRGCAQISVDVRAGKVTRAEALDIVERIDGIAPNVYADVWVTEVLERLELAPAELRAHLDHFTNWELFPNRLTNQLTKWWM